MKIKKNYIIINLFYSTFIILFFVSLFIFNSSLNYKVKYYDLEQKKFFHWISKQENKKSLISLNLGLLLNSELHTDKDVYISNITNVPSTIKRNDLQKRLNDIFYLYGFSEEKLKDYLSDYITLWEIDKNNYYNEHQLNLALLNKIIFYENFQNNYIKEEPIRKLTESYNQYLKNKKYVNILVPQICIITMYDEKFIQENSYFQEIKNSNTIYDNEFLKA